MAKINKSLARKTDVYQERPKLTLPRKLFLVLEDPTYNFIAKLWCILYYVMLAVSLVHFPLTTLTDFIEIRPEYTAMYGNVSFDSLFTANNDIEPIKLISMYQLIMPMKVIDYILRAFFTFDLVIRFVICPYKRRFFRDFHNIIDVFLISVTWCHFVVGHMNAIYQTHTLAWVLFVVISLEGTRTLRALHLAKRFDELKIMYLCIRSNTKELLLFVVVLTTAVFVFGTALFLAENAEAYKNVQWETVFKNIVVSMWWAVITLTTVGYGDFVPKTPAGMFIASMAALCGVLIIAMPVAIIAGNFSSFYDNITASDQSKRRRSFLEELESRTKHDARDVSGDTKMDSDTLTGVGLDLDLMCQCTQCTHRRGHL